MQENDMTIVRYLQKKFSESSVLLISGSDGLGNEETLKEAFPDLPFTDARAIRVQNVAQRTPSEFLGVFAAPGVILHCERLPNLAEIAKKASGGPALVLSGNPDRETLEVLKSLPGFSETELSPCGWSGGRETAFPADAALEEGSGGAPLEASRGALLRAALSGSAPCGGKTLYGFWSSWLTSFLDNSLSSSIYVRDRTRFYQFLRALAGSAGRDLNLRRCAEQSGVTPVTAKAWTELLQSLGVVRLVPPVPLPETHRYVLRPKLCFRNTGLAAFLLDLLSEEELEKAPECEGLLENCVLNELLSSRAAHEGGAEIFYYRDSNGVRVDFMLKLGGTLVPFAFCAEGDSVRSRARHLALPQKFGLPSLPGVLAARKKPAFGLPEGMKLVLIR